MKFDDVVKQFLSERGFRAFSVFASDIDGFVEHGINVPAGMTHTWESDRDRLTVFERTDGVGYNWAPGVIALPFAHEPVRDGMVVGLHHNDGISVDGKIKIVSFDPAGFWSARDMDYLNAWIKASLLPRVVGSPTAVERIPAFVKHSSDKPRPALFPPMALESVAAVLAFGSKKYAPGNWKNAPYVECVR